MVIPEPLVPARVLLVDDGPQQLELRAHVMKMCGLSIITACGPIEAISILEDTMEKIDVAILDYHMSVMNGCALADRLRSTYPEAENNPGLRRNRCSAKRNDQCRRFHS